MSAPAPRHRSRPPASPPEPSASRRRSDTARSASSSDSFGSSSARAGAGLRPAARRLRPVLAAALLFLPLLASLPEVAQGQTTFVKNTGQTTIGNTLRAFTRDTAQAFTTGSSATGYKLTSVVFKFHTLYNDPPSFTVAIHADSSGSPGSSLGTLTNPALTAGSNQKFTFTASGQGIDLAANTQYWIVIDNTSTNVLDTTAGWAITASDSEDAGVASGWSIANNSADRASSSTGSFTTDADALQLEIVGVAKSADLATSVTLSMSELSTSTLRLLETGSATYTVVLDAEPTADVTMTIMKGGTHTDAANVSRTSHTFTSGTNGTWDDPVAITVTGVDQNTGGNRNRNHELTLSHAFTSTDSRYNNISRSLAVKVDDAPEVEAWEGWVRTIYGPGIWLDRPKTITATRGINIRQDIHAGPLAYTIRLSNRPATGGTVTVTATVGDSNLAGISLTRDGAPQSSLTLTFSDRDPSPHCDNSHHNGGGEDWDNTAETSWQCWRKVWVHDLAAGKTGVLGCTDITHTASGGGVRGMTGPHNWSLGVIRAHMYSQTSNGQEYRCPLITGKGSDPGMGATSNSPLQVSGPPTDPVSNLQLAAVDASSAKATWDAVAGAAGYRVEWEAADGLNVVAGVQDGVTETAFTIAHNTPSATSLTVKVIPEHVDGEGNPQALDALAGTATLALASGPSDSAALQDAAPQGPAEAALAACVPDGLMAEAERLYEQNRGKPPGYAENWFSVLLAFGQRTPDQWTADDRLVTPMTAASARERGWRRFGDALACLEAYSPSTESPSTEGGGDPLPDDDPKEETEDSTRDEADDPQQDEAEDARRVEEDVAAAVAFWQVRNNPAKLQYWLEIQLALETGEVSDDLMARVTVSWNGASPGGRFYATWEGVYNRFVALRAAADDDGQTRTQTDGATVFGGGSAMEAPDAAPRIPAGTTPAGLLSGPGSGVCVSARLRAEAAGRAGETWLGQAHVERWLRVLWTFSGGAGDATVVTPAEADFHAAAGGLAHWLPVADALRCLEARALEDALSR